MWHDPEQRFACRDCPARCCRLPGRVTLLPEEHERLAGLPWVKERLRGLGVLFEQRKGVIQMPAVEVNRLRQCAFLDDDGLCSIHKREGVEATPLTCRTFPFGFVREPGGLRTYLSHVCPSIRDNYGEPMAGRWEEKRRELAMLEPKEMASVMTVGGVELRREDYLEWVERTAAWIEGAAHPAGGIARVMAWTEALGQRVAEAGRLPEDWRDLPPPDEVPWTGTLEPRMWRRSTRLLLGLGLLQLGYPMRLGSLCGKARLYAGVARFMAGVVRLSGAVDLMFTPGPGNWAAAARVPAPGGRRELGERVGRFTGGLLRRRNMLLRAQALEEVGFRLALAAALVSWFARIRAASRGAAEVAPEDVREGESACEYTLSYHGTLFEPGSPGRAVVEFAALYPPLRAQVLGVI